LDKAKNIIITGEEVDFNFEELKSMGVSVYHYPMISISKIDNQIDSNDYDYIIFTSKNGVRYFLKNLSSKINRNLKFICIGNKTAQSLVENKLNPYFHCKKKLFPVHV
jgi:uroporphyrinogen-III synthase